MFWRRKKADEEAQPSQRLVQEYTPDQVADALLGGRPLGSETPAAPQEGEQPPSPESAAVPLAAQAQAASPTPAAPEEDEFYFEADTESEDPASPAEPLSAAQAAPQEVQQAVAAPSVPAAPPAPADTVAALMGTLKGVAQAQAAQTTPLQTTPLQTTQAQPVQPQHIQTEHAQPEPQAVTLPEVVLPPVPQLAVTSEVVASEAVTPEAAPPLPVSNMDWPLGALRGVALEPAAVAEALAPDWAAAGVMLQDSGALRLVRNVVLRVPLLLSRGDQELWVFVYPEASAEAAAHFVAVERKANLYGAVAVYLAPQALTLSGVQPEVLGSELEVSLQRWPKGKPFPEGDYALWWPTQAGEHLASSEDGRLLGRVFTLQDEAASMLYGLLSQQLDWNHEGEALRRALPETTQYLEVMDAEGRPMVLSAAQDKGVRLHLPRSPESEQLRHYWLEQTEQLLKVLVELLLQSNQPLDTLWHDYETRPSQWWKAAQQVLDLRLEIGDDLGSIMVGSVAEEQGQEG